MGILAFIVAAGLASAGTARAQSPDQPAAPAIGTITIRVLDVFDADKPSESKALYRWLNRLHFETRHSWVRRELLFKEGEPLRPERLAETERNLRSFGILRKVLIETIPNGDKVDIVVTVQDAWTLEFQVNFKREGGVNTYTAGIVEKNLAGTGRTAGIYYTRDPSHSHRTFGYRDPHFLGRKLDLTGALVEVDDGRFYRAALEKPFQSAESRWSGRAGGSVDDQRSLPLYEAVTGSEVGRFEKKHREGSLSYGRSLGSTSYLTRRAFLTLRHESDDYEEFSGSRPDLLPRDRELGVLELAGDIQSLDFIRERHIEKFDRIEDFNLGLGASAALGGSAAALGSTRGGVLPSASARGGHAWGDGRFALLSTGFRGEVLGEQVRNLLWTSDLQAFYRLGEVHTLAAHAEYSHGSRLDQDRFFTLGEDLGLRGYKVGAFAGPRRALINLEDRVFWVDDLFHLVSLGNVLFFDAGYAWPEGRRIGLADLRASAGLGFRIAFSRSTRNVPIRIDLAYPLNGENLHRVTVAVQAGKSFGKTGAP